MTGSEFLSDAAATIEQYQRSVRSDFDAYGFSVVRLSCAMGKYTFGHELGHNMGARHDRFKDNNDGLPYMFNHGFIRPAPSEKDCNPWRTIMAYNAGCKKIDKKCTRQKFWSNPGRSHCGDPTGIAAPDTSAADNRRTLDLTAATVARFR